MSEKQKLAEQILDARDNISASIRKLRTDSILFSMFECLLQESLPFSVSQRERYGFFLHANENFLIHLKELDSAWAELECCLNHT